jgi:ornithine cyclodeaminase
MVKDELLLYLRRSDVRALCKNLDCVGLLREAFSLHASEQTIVPEEAYLGWRNGSQQLRSLGMPAYVGGRFQTAGTKIINSNPSNIDRNIPRADGLTLIHDYQTGRIVCVMEGAYLSGLRTAAVTMLAAELLAVEPVERVAVIGAGFLAKSHIELFPKYLPSLTEVLLYDVRPERSTQLKDEVVSLLQSTKIDLRIVADAETAIRSADLVIPVTTTTESYIRYDWLKPGCLLVNVSLDDVDAEVVLKADLLVVDDWNLVQHDDKRLLGRMFRAGQIVGPYSSKHDSRVRPVDAEIGDIVRGTKTGRRKRDDIILMNPFGVAIDDVVLGGEIYRLARAQGIGIELPR